MCSSSPASPPTSGCESGLRAFPTCSWRSLRPARTLCTTCALAGEQLLQPSSTVPEWLAVTAPELADRADAMPPMSIKAAVSVAAAGSGMVIAPLSVARLHHRKDVVQVPVSGVAPSRIGLAWRVDDDDERIETFIGTERSSRGETGATGATMSNRSAPGPSTVQAPASGRDSGARRSSKPTRRGGTPKLGSSQRRRKRR